MLQEPLLSSETVPTSPTTPTSPVAPRVALDVKCIAPFITSIGTLVNTHVSTLREYIDERLRTISASSEDHMGHVRKITGTTNERVDRLFGISRASEARMDQISKRLDAIETHLEFPLVTK